MLRMYIVWQQNSIHQTLLQQFEHIRNALTIRWHVNSGIELIKWALSTEEVVLNIAAQFGELQHLIDVQEGALQ